MSVDPLTDLLDALADLRRFWERPDRKRRFLAELGEPIELGVLRALAAVSRLCAGGEDADGPGIGAVACAMAVDGSTASRLVDQGVAGGYLLRTPGRADRRRTRLELTTRGGEVVGRAQEIRRRWLSDITAGWAVEDVARLADLLRRFLDDDLDDVDEGLPAEAGTA